MNTIETQGIIADALNLLSQSTPATDDLPAQIEALNITAFDVQVHITSIEDGCGVIEEFATSEASAESNADKRKVRRAEILRDDDDYNALRAQAQVAERIKLQLSERSHRLAREYRAHLINREANLLGRRN